MKTEAIAREKLTWGGLGVGTNVKLVHFMSYTREQGNLNGEGNQVQESGQEGSKEGKENYKEILGEG